MSTLQISLAVVGVILLGLIVAYNTWTHRRNAPKRADAETRLSDNHSRFDPALDGVDVTNLPEHARTPLVDPLLDATPAQQGGSEGGGWTLRWRRRLPIRPLPLRGRPQSLQAVLHSSMRSASLR